MCNVPCAFSDNVFNYPNRRQPKFIHQNQKMRFSSQGFKKDCEKSLGLMPILSSLRFDSYREAFLYMYLSNFYSQYFSTLYACRAVIKF